MFGAAPTALIQNKKQLFRAEGEEILGAFDGLLEAAEEGLEVVPALDEIDVGGVDDQEVGGRVAEKEMLVGAGDFLDVYGGDMGFVAGGFFGDTGAEDFGFGLEIDDQIGSGNVRGEDFVIALIELELGVVEIEIGEDAVLFHEEIREDGAGSFDGEGFAEALLALDEEVHLGAKGGAGFCFIEVGEEGIVLAIVDAAGVRARVLLPTRRGPSMTMKRGSCGLRCGTRARLAAEESLPGIVLRDRGLAGVNRRIIAESRQEVRIASWGWESGTAGPKM